MALGYDMTDLINSTNAAAESIYAYLDRKEEKERYENEQKRLQEQDKLEEEWRKKNYELQQSAFDYQKELNKKQMEREDTQFSRSMEDYKRAGLSGLAAIGSSAGAGSLTSLPAPQMDTSGSRDVLNSRINSNRNRTQSRLERYKAVMANHLQFKQLQLERTNQVLQSIKLGNDISKANIEKEKLSAEIKAIQHRDSWEYDEGHGYRNEDWQSRLISLVDYIYRNRNSESITSAKQQVQDVVNNVGDSLGLTENGRAQVVSVEVSKFHNGQMPKDYILSQKNALDILHDLNRGRSPYLKDVQSIWDTTPLIRKEFQNNFSNFQNACNSKSFIKQFILN